MFKLFIINTSRINTSNNSGSESNQSNRINQSSIINHHRSPKEWEQVGLSPSPSPCSFNHQSGDNKFGTYVYCTYCRNHSHYFGCVAACFVCFELCTYLFQLGQECGTHSCAWKIEKVSMSSSLICLPFDTIL